MSGNIKNRPLNTTEAAEILSCTEKKIRALCKKGALQYFLVGNRYKIYSDDLRRFAEIQKVSTEKNIKEKINLKEYIPIHWHFVSREGETSPLQTVRAQNIVGYLVEISELVQRITSEAVKLKVSKKYSTNRLCAIVCEREDALEIQIARSKDIKYCANDNTMQPQEAKPKKKRWNEKLHNRDTGGKFVKSKK